MISIWEKESFFAPQDVVIIGSGLVGLWSALYIKKQHPKSKVTILDRGLIPTGASTRNAGFACFGSLSELIADSQKMGTDKMLQLVEMRYKGLQRIQKYFDAENIDFDLCGGYELYDASAQIDIEKVEANIQYINALLKPITGTKKTFRLADEQIQNFCFGRTKHLVKNNLEGYLHSGKLVQCLLQKVQGMGVQVLNNISITHYNISNNIVELHTDKEISFTTKRLLICTNAFAKELVPHIDIVPARGQVLVTSPIKHLPFNGTFHADEGYYYFRNLGDQVLLGGARNKAFAAEETTAMQTSDFIQTELENYLSDVILPHYKGQYAIEHRWSGIMAMGSEKMPIVEQIQSNVCCAVRMSGMGVALSPIVGQKAANLLFD